LRYSQAAPAAVVVDELELHVPAVFDLRHQAVLPKQLDGISDQGVPHHAPAPGAAALALRFFGIHIKELHLTFPFVVGDRVCTAVVNRRT
jgi:hypothetical protein